MPPATLRRAVAIAVLLFLGFFWFFTLRIVWRNYMPAQEDISLLLKYWKDFVKPVLATAFAAATMLPFLLLALSPDAPDAPGGDQPAHPPR